MSSSEISRPQRTSAYFSFCKQYREEVKARLKKVGQPVSAPSLTKALGELWSSLPEPEKHNYKDPSYFCPNLFSKLSSGNCEANEDQACEKPAPPNTVEEFDIEAQVNQEETKYFKGENEIKESAGTVPEGGTKDGAKAPTEDVRIPEDTRVLEDSHVKHGGCTESGGLVFPLARIKRIIKLDKEIRVVAADASNLIAHASQLFLEHLAAATHAEAHKKKHKSIRLEDVKMAVKRTPRMNDFLAEALNDALHHHKEDGLEESDDEGDVPEECLKGHANKKSRVTKKSLLEAPVGNRRIADFFGANMDAS